MLTTNESVENYLETILVLSQKLPVVRSVDVANETGYKKSSVSVAMKNLREMCYIEVSDSGYITLTAAGKKIAPASVFMVHKSRRCKRDRSRGCLQDRTRYKPGDF